MKRLWRTLESWCTRAASTASRPKSCRSTSRWRWPRRCGPGSTRPRPGGRPGSSSGTPRRPASACATVGRVRSSMGAPRTPPTPFASSASARSCRPLILTIAVGVGASTALFAVVDAVVLSPLPFPEPEALVRIFDTNSRAGVERTGVTTGNLADWRRRARLFHGIAGYSSMGRTLSGEGTPRSCSPPR